LFFVATSEDPNLDDFPTLWTSKGVLGTTAPLIPPVTLDFFEDIVDERLLRPITTFAGRAYLVDDADLSLTGLELWRSDGSPSGTFLTRDIAPGAN
jgi:ELWxxDGT repeat protein